MEDSVLGVQVDAHGLLLDGHDGEAHVDAAVELPFLQLREGGQGGRARGGTVTESVCPRREEPAACCTYISRPLGVLEEASLQQEVPLGRRTAVEEH